ncbi:MAG: 50S ribosomal protein L29 [Planctomycetota bacterium]|nr:50S ribosomal protein L29 [Planctomycetota bacterium]
MSTIKAQNLREKTDQELLDQIAQEKKRIFDATVRGASGEAIKPHEKREGKRLIARIQTILRERALRAKLEARIAKLQPASLKAAPKFANLAKREARPQTSRIRARHWSPASEADRAAVNLAEAKRQRAALQRQDVGQGK